MRSDVLIVALSATITRNVLECIRESLHLHTPVHLYKRTLDRPNITYMVQEIKKIVKKIGFQELDILIPSGGAMASLTLILAHQTGLESNI